MPGNSFGQLFRITTFGASHGAGIGVVIDGCPSGLAIDSTAIEKQLQRRRPGQSRITTQRRENESFQILAGAYEGRSTGTPLVIWIPNSDQRSRDYDHLKHVFRPSHADFTYQEKYGHRDHRGGGRSSARETAARVAAGAVANMLLSRKGIRIRAFVSQVGSIGLPQTYKDYDLSTVDDTIVRCPHPETANAMIELIEGVRKAGDTIGGRITCAIEGAPIGLGEPVFDKLHADLGKAMLSINAVKGFAIGSGFRAIEMRGSTHNDAFVAGEDGQVETKTNHSGGIQGGISNGMDIYFDVAFKPVATIVSTQATVDDRGKDTTVVGKGRHDPCVVPRAVPIVEAMAALVLVDHLLRDRTSRVDDVL